jgi:transcriptional antiterminator NusG
MDKKWYIVHAYSNFERKVADSIREKAQATGLGDLFDEILVPTEKVVEVRRGRKVDTERKFFPGYVLVKMHMTDEAYHLIKNTPKVTGFLGADNKPMAISEAEAGRSRRFPSRWASRCASPMGRSLRLTVWSRKLTTSAPA